MNLVEYYKLKIGDEIRCIPTDCEEEESTENYEQRELVGMIGEINNEVFYVWNNTHDGSGKVSKLYSSKYTCSWSINLQDSIDIEIIKRKTPIDCRKLNKSLI